MFGYVRNVLHPAARGRPLPLQAAVSPFAVLRLMNRLQKGKPGLLVMDMAGTTVDEGGLVYETLASVLQENNIFVTPQALAPWHGASKAQTICHFGTQQGLSHEEIHDITLTFEARLSRAYTNNVTMITPELPAFLTQAKNQGIWRALNTGYPRRLQYQILESTRLDRYVDRCVCVNDVACGRPAPDMMCALMDAFEVPPHRTIKVGDTCNDMLEAMNAGVSVRVGVLTGADDERALRHAGATHIADSITSGAFSISKSAKTR